MPNFEAYTSHLDQMVCNHPQIEIIMFVINNSSGENSSKFNKNKSSIASLEMSEDQENTKWFVQPGSETLPEEDNLVGRYKSELVLPEEECPWNWESHGHMIMVAASSCVLPQFKRRHLE